MMESKETEIKVPPKPLNIESIKIELANNSKPQHKSRRTQQLLRSRSSLFLSFKRFSQHHQFELDTCWAVLLFLFDVYKIVVGSFLTVFTYQSCDLLNERFGCYEQPYEIFVLAWNCLTFVCCFVLLGFQIHREAYFIRELFVYPNLVGSIEEYFEKLPVTGGKQDMYQNDIIEQIVYFNSRYAFCVKVNVCIYLINIIVSGICIYNYSYMGSKSITSFASNVLLLALLIAKGVVIVHKTVNAEHVIAVSAYKQDYLEYNGANIWTRARAASNKLNSK